MAVIVLGSLGWDTFSERSKDLWETPAVAVALASLRVAGEGACPYTCLKDS
jgi:hypothetical protein